jgi:5-methylcytosine-specific restriction endonuclease McrA
MRNSYTHNLMKTGKIEKPLSVTNLIRQIRWMDEYEDWKRAVFMRDRFTCQHCGVRNGRKRIIEADHIVSINTIVRNNGVCSLEMARTCVALWDVNNGRTLCHSCHEKTESYPVRFSRR